MVRVLLLIMSVLLFAVQQVSAFEVIYPSDKKNVTTNDYAFFVGKAKSAECLTINGHSVPVASNGAFAHSVKLKEGENRIVLRTAYGIQVYKFYKSNVTEQPIPTENFSPVKAYVKNDNTPLRSTPVDAGLNRLSHLFEGTELVINGSKGSFYRVFLSDKTEAWIAKAHVTLTDDTFQPAEFMNMDSERFKNAMIQKISFNKKLPYTVEDGENEIIFRVYNSELGEESVYNINIPKPEKYSYSVNLEQGTYTFKVWRLPEDKNEITVVIDAGHGGSERGAIGCLGDEEKNINLKIAEYAAEYLKNKDINVVMTRECDADMSLNDRVNYARENKADIFVSIHLNSIADIPMNVHKNRGTSVYYFNNNAKQLAEAIEENVTHYAKTRDDEVRTASFAVIRPTDYIGVLVETAYMTNPFDSVLYRNDKWLKKAAKGISEGILDFIKK